MNKILILDFGSQYTQLIARKVREIGVYCEIHPYDKIPAIDPELKGVILSGSPYSVNDADAPEPDLSAIRGKFPILGICYGAQWLGKRGWRSESGRFQGIWQSGIGTESPFRAPF